MDELSQQEHAEVFELNPEFAGGEDATSYENNHRLMHDLAIKAHKKLRLAGYDMPYDDVFQEVSVSYCKARDGFKPESGFRFSTYFVTAFWRNFAKVMEKLYRYKPVEGVSLNSFSLDSGDDSNLESILAVDEQGYTPEEYFWHKEAISYTSKRLDALSRRVLEEMVDPSDELMAALANEKGRGNVTIVPVKNGYSPAYHDTLKLDFVVRHVTRSYNLSSDQLGILTKKVRKAFNDVAAELEAM